MAFFGNTHINGPLTNISVRYNWAEGIADRVFPSVSVKKESDLYFIYDGSNIRLDETIRANHAESNVVEEDVSTGSYSLEEHALKTLITRRDRDNSDAPLSLDVDATKTLTEKILIRREFETVKIAFTTATWSANATIASASAWDTSTSNPIADVLTGTGIVLRNGHVRPKHAVAGYEVFNKLKVNSTIVDRIKYTSRDSITEAILASLFDIDELIIGASAYNPSAEGIAASTTFLWGKDFLLYHKSNSPRLRSASAGYNLTIKSGGKSVKVKKWREEKLDGDYIEVSTMFQTKVVATNSGYLFKQVVI